MQMWQMFLEQWNCVSMFHEITITSAADMELCTDASSTLGFGGFFKNSWFYDKWPDDLPNEGDEKLSMAFRELYPIVIAAILWGKYWSTKRIKFFCDNLGTVQIIRKGRSKVKYINKLMRQLTWCSVKHNFCIYAEHLPGKTNVIADALSRFQIMEFKRLVPNADEKPQQVPPLSKVMWKFKDKYMD